MTEVALTSIALDGHGRLFLDYLEDGKPRSLCVDLKISDLTTLARFAVEAAQTRLNLGSTLLDRMEANDSF